MRGYATLLTTRIISAAILLTFLALTRAYAQDSSETIVEPAGEESGYRIDAPGTITFTVGVKIMGKVEKPQVVIFLPKEKSHFREMSFSHSFENELLQPIPFTPIVE